MNKKKIASMLLLVAATASSIALDTTYANATENKNVSVLEARNGGNAKGKVINVTTNLRVRKGKSTNSEVVGYLREGQTFDVLAKEGSWYKINNNGKVGYVFEEYVQVIEENSNTRSAQTGVVVNITSNLRVRSGASTNSSTLGYLRNGDKLNIVS
ncbi:MAG: SH3 domain-containing protein, partial [Clostridium baratii]